MLITDKRSIARALAFTLVLLGATGCAAPGGQPENASTARTTANGEAVVRSWQQADKAYVAGQMLRARTLYEAVLEQAPDSVEVLTRLGYIYYGTGDLQKARAYFNRALDKSGGKAPALLYSLAAVNLTQAHGQLLAYQNLVGPARTPVEMQAVLVAIERLAKAGRHYSEQAADANTDMGSGH